MTGRTLQLLEISEAWRERYARWGLLCACVVVGIAGWFRWIRIRRRAYSVSASQSLTCLSHAFPLISILLPAWNNVDDIGPCIESILGLRYPSIELMVCAGGDDGTIRKASEYAASNITILEQHLGEGKQRALQRCFECCSGEIIFLTDADCVLDDQSFEAVTRPIIDGLEDVTTGSWRPLDSQLDKPFVLYQWVDCIYHEVIAGSYVTSLVGRNAAIRRKALTQTGAFGTYVPIGTDLFLSNQLLGAGYHIRYVPDSKVQTKYSETFNAYARQLSRWFRNPLLLGRKRESVTTRGRLNSLKAGFAAVFMLGVPLVGGAGSKTVWFLWLAAAWHLVLNQLIAVSTARLRGVPRLQADWQYVLFLPYMVVSWMGAARGLVESLLPWRRWRW